ncbi:RloB family protein [Tenacibaculum agarivorans]|uniref:RloB family protein n=1 Tax=Tenacibaculum agarivorans TaxID=1908389 RepID=UPI00094B7BAD|nr:RloB family protein [Tenacibaculum agarivorans]
MAKKGKLNKFAKKEAKERPIRFKRYEYLFLIVCEDEKTEPSYFKEYKKQIPEETLYLKPVGTGRDPKGVVEKAIEERDKLAKEANKEVDCIWVVFDKDDADENATKISNFENAFEIAHNQNFKIAYSNETFELWLLLHFIDVDKNTPLPRAEIYKQLKEEFQKIEEYKDYEYDHYTIDERTIEIVFKSGNRDLAIERANILMEHHKENKPIEANPSTKVHLLISELLQWIKYYSYTP